jgi:hypothetical protein
MARCPVKIILDRWPETENDFQFLVNCLRCEFDAQVAERHSEASEAFAPFPPLETLYIHDLGRSRPDRPAPKKTSSNSGRDDYLAPPLVLVEGPLA